MTTDTKAVARYRAVLSHGLIEVEANPAGSFVLFTDHERVVKELRYWQVLADGYHTERDVALAALAASRAEVESLKRDAERWRYARRILDIGVIDDCQRNAYRNNNYAAESESIKADKAIDAAMKEQAE